jgi:hypothetical protein
MMKALLFFLSAVAFSDVAGAQPYECVFDNGSVVATKFPCDSAVLDKFARRLAQLLADPPELPLSGDVIKNAYVMAIGGCDEQTRGMTPEDLGKAGEPFLPWKETAAMVQAARELFCPEMK